MDEHCSTEEDSNFAEEEEDWSKPTEEVEPVVAKPSSLPSCENKCKYFSKYGHRRCIIHIDIDSFYAQVEMNLNPELKDKPVGVQQKYLMITCNYIARNMGVKKSMNAKEAKKVCPELVLVNGEDLKNYREYSQRTFQLCKEQFQDVERLGFDENFIDVTKTVDSMMKGESTNYGGEDIVMMEGGTKLSGHCFGLDGEDKALKEALELMADKSEFDNCDCGCYERLAFASSIAQDLRIKLQNQLGLTSCAGIAHSKILAKLIGSIHKPNQQTTIFPEFAEHYLLSLPVGKIPGIGCQLSKALESVGISTVQDLQKARPEDLIEKFGLKNANFMINIANGIDDADVVSSGEVKSISEEETFGHLSDFTEVKKQLTSLVDKLLPRIDNHPGMPKTIRLSVRQRSCDGNGPRESRQCAFDVQILKSSKKMDKILRILFALFEKMVNKAKPFNIALLNVCFANFKGFQVSESSSPIKQLFHKKRKTDFSCEGKYLERSEPVQKRTDCGLHSASNNSPTHTSAPTLQVGKADNLERSDKTLTSKEPHGPTSEDTTVDRQALNSLHVNFGDEQNCSQMNLPLRNPESHSRVSEHKTDAKKITSIPLEVCHEDLDSKDINISLNSCVPENTDSISDSVGNLESRVKIQHRNTTETLFSDEFGEIDLDVYNQLPDDIKAELKTQWRVNFLKQESKETGGYLTRSRSSEVGKRHLDGVKLITVSQNAASREMLNASETSSSTSSSNTSVKSESVSKRGVGETSHDTSRKENASLSKRLLSDKNEDINTEINSQLPGDTKSELPRTDCLQRASEQESSSLPGLGSSEACEGVLNGSNVDNSFSVAMSSESMKVSQRSNVRSNSSTDQMSGTELKKTVGESFRHSSRTESSSASEILLFGKCMEDIDSEIYSQLPDDVKSELKTQWRINYLQHGSKRDLTSNKNTKGKSPLPLKRKRSESMDDVGQRSIFKYFTK